MAAKMRSPRSTLILSEEAARILKKLKIKKPSVPISDVAEALGAHVRYSPFDGELAGMLVRGDNKQTIIGVNSLHHIHRQRFTIAHECGHLLFHKGDVHIDRGFRINKRDSLSSQAVDPEEIEANRFAAELLMPREMVIADVVDREIDIEDESALKELALRYQVSLQAMTHRIRNLLDDLF